MCACMHTDTFLISIHVFCCYYYPTQLAAFHKVKYSLALCFYSHFVKHTKSYYAWVQWVHMLAIVFVFADFFPFNTRYLLLFLVFFFVLFSILIPFHHYYCNNDDVYSSLLVVSLASSLANLTFSFKWA